MSMGPPRQRLNRSSVIRGAIKLADEEGLEAVTMRALADRLGVVPMALYKHVANKDDLVAAMVDALVAEMDPGSAAAAPWAAAVRESLRAARRVIRAHPWARRAIEAQQTRSVAVLGHQERLSAIFLDAGFTPDLTHHVMHLLGNRIWGFSPELFTAPTPDGSGGAGRQPSPTPDPADFPAIMAIAADAQARRPHASGCDEDFEFDFAVDVLLDGIERLQEAGWESPRR